MASVDRIYTGFPIVVPVPAELSVIEQEYADGSLPGVIVASKNAVYNSSGQLAMSRQIIADGAAVVLTADQSGSLIILDKTDGSLATLPEAAPGLWYEFNIVVAPASVGIRVACTTGDFIVGSVVLDDTDTGLASTAQAFNGSSHLAIDITEVAKGWLAGGWFTLTAISATQWAIRGHLLHTGNATSPVATV